MLEQVPVDKILNDRAVDPAEWQQVYDNLDMSKYNGEPIILTGYYELIDGMKRLALHRKFGLDTISAVVSEDISEIIAELALQHVEIGRDMPPRRIWESYSVTLAVAHRAKVASMRGRKRNEASSVKKPQLRKIFPSAVGLNSENAMQSLLYLYRLASESSPLGEYARRLVPQVEAGEITGIMARYRIHHWRKEQARSLVTSGPQQSRIIGTALPNALALAKALDETGAIHPSISLETLLDWRRLIDGIRLPVNGLRNRIQKRIEEMS